MVINNIKIKPAQKPLKAKVKNKTARANPKLKKTPLKKNKSPNLSLKEAVDKALTEKPATPSLLVLANATSTDPLRSKTGPMPLKADVVANDEAKNVIKSKAPLNRQAIKKAILDELAIDRSLLNPIKIQKTAIKKNKLAVPALEVKIPELPEEVQLTQPSKGLKTGFIIKSVVLAIVLLFVLLTASVYFGPITSPFNLTVASALPYPAIVVNKQPIKLADFQKDLMALEKYFERQNFPYQVVELKQNVVKNLTEKKVMDALAQAENITISETEISQRLNSLKSQESAPGEMDKMIKELYGWSIDDYSHKVIKPLLLAKKLEENFKIKSGDIVKKEKLQQYLAELTDDADKFAEIAATINEDDSKTTKGDLGWLSLTETSPEFAIVLLNLKEGETSAEVVETSLGYHIIKLLDKASDSNGKISFHVAHIFVKKTSFSDYLSQEIKKAKVISFVKTK